ncbi:terminase [Paenibacillus sp. MBLB4367]|uniref:terminase n=1 Tax=Paenibacillus sp. MBLB4367 TaxID=3384767 RepID=UPI0039083938
MGRRAQPIDLLAAGGKKHLTKAEIHERKQSEIKLGKSELDKLKPPLFVKNDTVAFGYWKQHIKEYKSAADQGIDLMTTSDVGMLAIYCKTYAEYERLLNAYQRIDSIAKNSGPVEQYMDDSEVFDEQVKRQLMNLVSIDGILRIESAINKKMDMLLKMQDRLFLNPLAKVKNVPKPKKDDKPVSKFAKFGGGAHGG